MATAGRKPRPPALKLLNGRGPGVDSGGRKVKPGPAFVRSAPTPPSWLSREARAEWRRVVPELERLKLLKQPSRSSLASYCESWATFVLASRDVTRFGATVERTTTRKDGSVVKERVANPAIPLQHASTRELRSWCAEFGLTPSSESRVKIPEAGGGAEDFD